MELSPHQAAFAAKHAHAPICCLIYRQPAQGTNDLLAYRGEGTASLRLDGLSDAFDGRWEEPIDWENVFNYLETL